MKSILELNAQRFAKSRKESVNGVEFWVAVSPYALPERLECKYDKPSGTLSVGFIYLDTEESRQQPGDDMVSFELGKRTGKLLTVKISVDHHDIDWVRMVLTREVPEALRKIATTKNSDNYQIAEDVLRDNVDELAELTTA